MQKMRAGDLVSANAQRNWNVSGPGGEEKTMRETIVWILFCVLLAVASFESGYIRRSWEKDTLWQEIKKVSERVEKMEVEIKKR